MKWDNNYYKEGAASRINKSLLVYNPFSLFLRRMSTLLYGFFNLHILAGLPAGGRTIILIIISKIRADAEPISFVQERRAIPVGQSKALIGIGKQYEDELKQISWDYMVRLCNIVRTSFCFTVDRQEHWREVTR